MAAGTQSHVAATPDVEPRDRPEISVCEGAPGTSVFLESGNTDGWIASDIAVDVTQ
ncbi:hypothetical protein HZS55_06520 [Halosimplex rubrum]|uniref:Uncharacterized protein n=1 Tax=Halosimplex rubrum TaxID=869889 RepID=A0A7D5T4H4_9EURY|nr:hypothetical protein [Halosimplex rubrum]QLH76969.1 hypothetical protein HZS55_06520 [Halosimplex rubrum]